MVHHPHECHDSLELKSSTERQGPPGRRGRSRRGIGVASSLRCYELLSRSPESGGVPIWRVGYDVLIPSCHSIKIQEKKILVVMGNKRTWVIKIHQAFSRVAREAGEDYRGSYTCVYMRGRLDSRQIWFSGTPKSIFGW